MTSEVIAAAWVHVRERRVLVVLPAGLDAFYLPGGNTCAVHAVIGDNDINADTPAVRIRVSLEPGQIVHIDTTENKSLNLQCGSNAEKLSIVDSEEAVAFGMTVESGNQTVKASASGF